VDLFEAVKERRSIRSFKPDPVPREKLMTALEAALWAPSAGNCQPWDFVIVEEASTKRQLVELALADAFVAQAPVVVVVCANTQRSAARYGERGRRFYCLLDAAAATQNLLLAVHGLGLGACWVGGFDDQAVASVLGLPPHVRAVAIVPVGVPAGRPPATWRMPLRDLIHYGRYGRGRIGL